MKLYYVPFDTSDYCIVNKEGKLIHQFPGGRAFNALKNHTAGTTFLANVSSERIRQNCNGIPPYKNRPASILLDFKLWYLKNINSVEWE